MKIEQREKVSESIIENILKNRGVENVELFLSPNSDDDSLIESFTFMEDAAKTLIMNLTAGRNIAIVVDPDADGYTSSAILGKVIKEIIKEYKSSSELEFIMQDGKHHGLTEHAMEKIQEIEPDLILIPDAGSNDLNNLLILSTAQYDTIIIDHHEIENHGVADMIENLILVNNQRDDNGQVSKWLTGAGMVYKFCECIYGLLDSSEEKLTPLEDYLDLVAIGQIGDASDISENEIRNLVFKGLKNIKTPFVKSVLKTKGLNENELTPQDMAFSIIPMINSITRIGSAEEKENLFNAMLITEDDDSIVEIEKRKLNKETRKYEKIKFKMPYTESIAEQSAKVKTRQDSIVKKNMEKLDASTNHKHGILIYKAEQLDEGSITGLVATKLSRKYEKPALVLLDSGDGHYSGSARGIESVMDSFKDWCEETKLFEFARGHSNAFGVKIKKDNMMDLYRLSEDFDGKPKDEYVVDYLYENNSINKDDIDLMISYKSIIGGKVEPPTVGFTNLIVKKNQIYTKGNTIEFKAGDVSFIMWGSPQHLQDSIAAGFDESFSITLVGEPFEVNFNGSKKNKVLVRDMHIDDAEQDKEIFF